MATGAQQLNFAIRAVNEASATLKQVQGDLGGVTDRAEKSSGALGKMGSALGGVAKIASGFVVAQGLLALPGLLTGAAQAAADDEAATMRLNKTLENYVATVGDANANMGDLTVMMNDQIAAGQKLAFSDDEVRDSMQALIAATGDFDEATKRSAAAMDLARGANIPLATATKMLGKLNEENVEIFKKMGIQIADNATETEVLGVVQAKFGGQADAYAKSTAGQMAQAKIGFDEAKEALGAHLLPILTRLATFLVSTVIPRVGELIEHIGPKVQQAISIAKQAIEFLMPIVRDQFALFMVYYNESIKPALDNIRAGFEIIVAWVSAHWPEIMEVIGPSIDTLVTIISTAFAVVTGILDALIKLIGGDFSGAWRAIGGVVEAMAAGVERVLRNMVNSAIGMINGLIAGFNAIPGMFNIPEIGARFATGGTMQRAGFAMVGERGPEVVALPQGARVYANGTQPDGMGGGTTYIYQQNAPVFGMLDLREQVLAMVNDGLRGGAFRGVIEQA